MDDRQYIDEPLKQYQTVFKNLHHKHVTEFFEELVKKSGVNADENATTVKKIRAKEKERDLVMKKISKYRGFQVLVFMMILTSIVGIIYSIYTLTQTTFQPLFAGIIVLAIMIIIGMILINRKKLKPVIKEAESIKAKIEREINELKNEAWQQMKPLNDLFREGMSKELFQKTVPLIKLDPMFDSKRLDYLVNRFGLFEDDDENRSALYVQSGEINGNPFYLCRDLLHHLGQKTYTGSITIHWTTTSVVNGKRVTNHHTQVLTASVEKPCPYYYEIPYLVYGNDAAPDLIFHREDSDAEIMNEKQIERKVKKDIRKLEKKSEKSITKGENYTVMGNSEFEVLFGAANRNHEVQFRLLFTPLAQKQLLEIMKDQEIGYGDDFDMWKYKKINRVYPEHLDDFELNMSPTYYHDYDLEVIRRRFVDYNNDYFKRVYFTFAPILAIPLYQHTLPHEYIYKGMYDSHVSFYEHEKVVNHMNETEFKHPLSTTRNILKTKVIKSADESDQIKVTAYGYRTEPRVDYVQKMCGDGRFHTIPVNWAEYIPLENESKVEIQVIEEKENESIQDRIKNMVENMKKGEFDKETMVVISTFIARVIK